MLAYYIVRPFIKELLSPKKWKFFFFQTTNFICYLKQEKEKKYIFSLPLLGRVLFFIFLNEDMVSYDPVVEISQNVLKWISIFSPFCCQADIYNILTIFGVIFTTIYVTIVKVLLERRERLWFFAKIPKTTIKKTYLFKTLCVPCLITVHFSYDSRSGFLIELLTLVLIPIWVASLILYQITKGLVDGKLALEYSICM